MGGRKEEPRQRAANHNISSTVTPSREYLSLSSQIGHHTRDETHSCSWQRYVNERPKDRFIAHDKYANSTPRPLIRYANIDPPQPLSPHTIRETNGTNNHCRDECHLFFDTRRDRSRRFYQPIEESRRCRRASPADAQCHRCCARRHRPVGVFNPQFTSRGRQSRRSEDLDLAVSRSAWPHC